MKLWFIICGFLVGIAGTSVFGVADQQNSKRADTETNVLQAKAIKMDTEATRQSNQDECGCLTAAFPKAKQLLSAGVFNSKAIEVPTPEYPTNAKIAKVFGEVRFNVVIDPVGRVVWARVGQGHPLLQPAAMKVVCQARFEPKMLGGQTVHVRATIAYSFALW